MYGGGAALLVDSSQCSQEGRAFLTHPQTGTDLRTDFRDVKHTATDPDALNNGGLMPSGRDSQFPTFVYEYSVEIRNDFPKGIRWLSWVYVLSDADNKQELDRREVVSFEKISPGKKKTVYDRKRLSPSLTGSEDRKRKNGPPLEERVEFLCVSYDDGRLWHPRFIPELRCREAGKSGKSR